MQHRSFHDQEREPYLQKPVGVDCRTVRSENMKGGARKQMYVLELAPVDHPCVVYIWHDVNHDSVERNTI